MPEKPSPHLTGHEQEIREGKTIGAFALLEESIVPDLHAKEPNYQVSKKLKNKLEAIQSKGRQRDPNDRDVTQEAIWITYNTQSGEIGFSESGFQIGEYSRLAVILNRKGEDTEFNSEKQRWETTRGQYEFHLFRPGNAPSMAEYSAALMTDANQTSPSEIMPNRWIQPERIIPGQSKLVGVHEIPGQSQFPVNTQGDFIIINALRRFNNKYSGKETNSPPQV
jgi:hypothetical protein